MAKNTNTEVATVKTPAEEVSLMDAMRAPISVEFRNAVIERMGDNPAELRKDSEGNEFFVATFKLTDGTTREIRNAVLAQKIQTIRGDNAVKEIAEFQSCKVLSELTRAECEMLGYDSVEALAKAFFDYSTSTTLNYRKVGRYLIGDNYLPVGAIPHDVPISTLQQVSSLIDIDDDGTYSIANIEKLFTTGLITSYMKQRVVGETLRKLKSITKEEDTPQLHKMDETQIAEVKQRVATMEAPKQQKRKKTVEGKATEVTVTPLVAIQTAIAQIREAFGENATQDIEGALETITSVAQRHFSTNSEEPTA